MFYNKRLLFFFFLFFFSFFSWLFLSFRLFLLLFFSFSFFFFRLFFLLLYFFFSFRLFFLFFLRFSLFHFCFFCWCFFFRFCFFFSRSFCFCICSLCSSFFSWCLFCYFFWSILSSDLRFFVFQPSRKFLFYVCLCKCTFFHPFQQVVSVKYSFVRKNRTSCVRHFSSCRNPVQCLIEIDINCCWICVWVVSSQFFDEATITLCT